MPRLKRKMSLWAKAAKGVERLPSFATCARRFQNWWELSRIYAGSGEFQAPFVARARAGYTITHWEPSDISTTWGIYCADSYHVLDACPTVVDLGANIGVFTLFAAFELRAQRIIALEPVSRTYQHLLQNIADNKLEPRVTTVRAGIAGEAGSRTIDLGVASMHACMYPRDDPNFESGQTEQIEVMTLAGLFESQGLEQIDFCKMDCEGGETEAIMASSDETLRRIRLLGLEYHFPQGISDEPTLFGRLAKAGFKPIKHDRAERLATFVREG
jgi:FkbM family methyltransferase